MATPQRRYMQTLAVEWIIGSCVACVPGSSSYLWGGTDLNDFSEFHFGVSFR